MKGYKKFLAIDDSFFKKPGKCFVVEVLWRERVVGLGVHSLWTDPGDLTEFVRRIVHQCNADLVFVDGVTICGFGMWDPSELEVPTIAVLKKVPKLLKAKDVILRLHGIKMWNVAKELIRRLESVEVNKRKFYIARYGIDKPNAINVLRKTCKYSYFPEPLRLADVIARELGSRFIKETSPDS